MVKMRFSYFECSVDKRHRHKTRKAAKECEAQERLDAISRDDWRYEQAAEAMALGVEPEDLGEDQF